MYRFFSVCLYVYTHYQLYQKYEHQRDNVIKLNHQSPLKIFSSFSKDAGIKACKSNLKARMNFYVRWYMSSFHSCFLCCLKTCQNNPQQRSLKGMSALWLCKSNWVLYSRFKIFITQELLTASWFVSVFYGYSCHRQPPQFLIIFYGMCLPSSWIPQPLFASKDIFHWEEEKHCFGTPSLEILLYNYLLVTTVECESPSQIFNLQCQDGNL